MRRIRPPGDANGPDGEVMLDIEVVGAIVPQAKIAVYFAPNTDAGFLDAITTAVHDTTNKPSVISISWGGPESTWTAQAMTAMDDAFQAAATLGCDGVRCFGRQRFQRRRHRWRRSRGFPRLESFRARLRRHQSRGHRKRHQRRSLFGMTAPTAAPAAAASAHSSRRPPGSRVLSAVTDSRQQARR